MTEKLVHRGPDDEGYLLADPVSEKWIPCIGEDSIPGLGLPTVSNYSGETFSLALGFRRLSIIDLASTGHQPMASMDSRYWIVFNGEIYNYKELRVELLNLGYSFRSNSDTETVMYAYDHWGKDMFSHLVGMFAFALVDRTRSTMLLARDFFGIKPLYYWRQNNIFAFSSEIGPLFEIPHVKRVGNPGQLYEFLCYSKSDYGDSTFFRDVKQLPAANFMEIDLRSPAKVPDPVCYWKVTGNKISISPTEAAEELRRLFFTNIQLHSRSDVEIGTSLSGGIDSSAIAMVLKELVGNDRSFHTFSYLAPNQVYNEESWSNEIASTVKSQHHTGQMEDVDPEVMNDLIKLQQEPFGGTSIVAQEMVYGLAHKAGIKVLLDGQGADESLAGYPIYRVYRLISLLREGRLVQGFQFFNKIAKRSEVKPSVIPLIVAGSFLSSPVRQYFRQHLANDTTPEWLNPMWFSKQGIVLRPNDHVMKKNALTSELLRSITETSLPMLLRYVDRNSMHHSIESRVPFLTPDFVSFIVSLPEDYLINNEGQTKWIFRRAMDNIVQAKILERNDKVGFKTPEEQWLLKQNSWVQTIFNSDKARSLEMFNIPALKAFWGGIVSGKTAYSPVIWRCINVIQWTRMMKVEFEET